MQFRIASKYAPVSPRYSGAAYFVDPIVELVGQSSESSEVKSDISLSPRLESVPLEQSNGSGSVLLRTGYLYAKCLSRNILIVWHRFISAKIGRLEIRGNFDLAGSLACSADFSQDTEYFPQIVIDLPRTGCIVLLCHLEVLQLGQPTPVALAAKFSYWKNSFQHSAGLCFRLYVT